MENNLKKYVWVEVSYGSISGGDLPVLFTGRVLLGIGYDRNYYVVKAIVGDDFLDHEIVPKASSF